MYAAMMAAKLGDDVLGDDPTVIELEESAAAIMGKEASLFVPSGTMGNQIALCLNTSRGDAAIFAEGAHMLQFEVGGPAVLAQVLVKTVPCTDHMNAVDIEAAIQVATLHQPGTTCLCVENTHNNAGGTVVPLKVMQRYVEIARRHGLRLHVDGARIFNAATALNVPVAELVEDADSVSFCLSKGLGSPVGSLLCGSKPFIDKARIWRKRLGGGMRQSGLLAACGLISIHRMVNRLHEDHQRAKTISDCLSEIKGFRIKKPETNIVMIECQNAQKWVDSIAKKGVKAIAFAQDRIRLVLHYGIDDEGLRRCVDAFRSAEPHCAS